MTESGSQVLRPGLLAGRSLVLAGAESDDRSFNAAVGQLCRGLGAVTAEVEVAGGDPVEAEEATAAAVRRALGELGGGCDGVVLDGDALFASRGLVASLQAVWTVTRALASEALIPGGGRIALIAPRPSRGAQAGAAVAAVENLARTLSIEWSRHGITTVAVAPGGETSAGEVAEVAAYLAGPAGGYFSGCLLDLRGIVAREPSA